MFKLNEMLKQSDGFHIVTLHSTDVVFRDAMLEAMQAKGWETHSFSQIDDTTTQWAFVTAEKKKELHEQHLHSCRNSLGSAEEVLGKKPGILDGIIARVRSGPLSRRFKQEPVVKEDPFFDILDIHHSREVPPGHVTIEMPKLRGDEPPSATFVLKDIDRSYSELRAEDLERQQRESYPPREALTRPLPRDEHRDYSRPSRLSDDDDYSRRSSPAPISDPSPPSDYSSDNGGSTD